MQWSDERYVRLFTRDSSDWLMWPWQSRALFPLLLRKVNRAGVLPLGKFGIRGLATVVGLPEEVAQAGLEGLLEDGCVVANEGQLAVRNFIEAQEARASDARRAKDYRERQRDEIVTPRHAASQNVTESSRNVTPASHAVTPRHRPSQTVTPSLAVPSRAAPNQATETTSSSCDDGAVTEGDQPAAQKPPAFDASPYQLAWNEKAPPKCPRWVGMNDSRKRACAARVKDTGPDWLDRALERIAASPFLRGDKTDWSANPDWILKPANLLKVLEGTYDEKTPVKGRLADISAEDHAKFAREVGIQHDF